MNEIMDAVTRRLDELFDGGYAVYTDAVEQGIEYPCFFVQLLEPSRKPLLGGRSFQETGLCVQYIPAEETDGKSRELNRVAEILFDGMEYIALSDGSRVRGTGRSCRPEDGVLNFFVSYNLLLTVPSEPKESMKEIAWKGVCGSGEEDA